MAAAVTVPEGSARAALPVAALSFVSGVPLPDGEDTSGPWV